MASVSPNVQCDTNYLDWWSWPHPTEATAKGPTKSHDPGRHGALVGKEYHA